MSIGTGSPLTWWLLIFLLFMSMPAYADNAPKDRQILHLEKVIDDGTILASGKTMSFRGITIQYILAIAIGTNFPLFGPLRVLK